MFLHDEEDYIYDHPLDSRGWRCVDHRPVNNRSMLDVSKRRKIEQSENYWFLAADETDDCLEDGTSDATLTEQRSIGGALEPSLEDSDTDEWEWDSEEYDDSDSSLEGLLVDSEGDDDVFEPETDITQKTQSSRNGSPGAGDDQDRTLTNHRQLGPQELQHIMTTTPPIRGHEEYNWPWLD